MTNENFIAGIYWLNHKITAGEYISQVYDYLRKLKEFSVDYAHPQVIDRFGDIHPLPDELSSFHEALLPLLQAEDTWYTDRNGNKTTEVNAESLSQFGFYKEFIFDKDDEAILVSINAGNFSTTADQGFINNVIIEFPSNDSKYYDFEFVKALFLLTINSWHPRQGLVISKEFRNKIDNGSKIFIGWINYFADSMNVFPLVKDQFHVEELSQGVIAAISLIPPSAENENDVVKAAYLRDVLQKSNIDILK